MTGRVVLSGGGGAVVYLCSVNSLQGRGNIVQKNICRERRKKSAVEFM